MERTSRDRYCNYPNRRSKEFVAMAAAATAVLGSLACNAESPHSPETTPSTEPFAITVGLVEVHDTNEEHKKIALNTDLIENTIEKPPAESLERSLKILNNTTHGHYTFEHTTTSRVGAPSEIDEDGKPCYSMATIQKIYKSLDAPMDFTHRTAIITPRDYRYCAKDFSKEKNKLRIAGYANYPKQPPYNTHDGVVTAVNSVGTIVHEFGHSIGLPHQVSLYAAENNNNIQYIRSSDNYAGSTSIMGSSGFPEVGGDPPALTVAELNMLAPEKFPINPLPIESFTNHMPVELDFGDTPTGYAIEIEDTSPLRNLMLCEKEIIHNGLSCKAESSTPAQDVPSRIILSRHPERPITTTVETVDQAITLNLDTNSGYRMHFQQNNDYKYIESVTIKHKDPAEKYYVVIVGWTQTEIQPKDKKQSNETKTYKALIVTPDQMHKIFNSDESTSAVTQNPFTDDTSSNVLYMTPSRYGKNGLTTQGLRIPTRSNQQ